MFFPPCRSDKRYKALLDTPLVGDGIYLVINE